MKFFVILIAMHVLLVSVFPCCLFDGCVDEQNTTGQSTDNLPETEECGEACSPFLVCQTCSGFALVQVSIGLTFVSSHSPVISQSSEDLPSAFSHDIWHPPRLT